jgi:16S rRNA (adenine1518-N6/adenine1519-N6)-dimethyltransferase
VKRKELKHGFFCFSAFYDAEYLFTVDENVFIPPPKVKSGVLRLRRKKDYSLPWGEVIYSS